MAHAGDAPTLQTFPLPPLTLADFRPETIRGAAGFFRAGQTRAGQWWLIDADDRAFFSCGVNAVGRGVQGAFATTADSFPPMGDLESERGADDPLATACARLRAWHVNTLGPWSAPEFRAQGFASTEFLEFSQAAPQTVIRLGGAHAPDVFDPKWSEACLRRAAEICPLWRDAAGLIGYFTDDELNWAQFPAGNDGGGAMHTGRPTLLQICLSLEPNFPAYHAAWEFVRAAHGGEIAALARAWAAELPNKEALRQLTLADTPLTGAGYRRDHERFSREFARRYFAVCATAIRRHDPHHLILGCRFGAPPGAAMLAECVAPQVDVISVNHRATALWERIDGDARAGGMPVLLGEFSWANENFTAPARPGETPGLTSVERMLARGRAELARACAHPALVGGAWARWADAPGDRPPFGQGLVRVDGGEAREHTESLSDLYARAVALRRAAASFDQP